LTSIAVREKVKHPFHLHAAGCAMHSNVRQFLLGWLRRFGFVSIVYVAALAVSLWTMRSDTAGSLRTALILAPILPGLALIGLTVRAYSLADEFIRLRIAQAAAVAATVTAAFALVCFYLELVGMPRLSTAWISNILWVVFVAQMVRLSATGK